MNVSFCKPVSLAVAALCALLMLSACGGGSSSATSGSTGKVTLDVTDAPAMDFAHVYVTVKSLAFHTLSSAGSVSAGWQTVDLPSPVTVDLAQLANGRMYSDIAGSPLFNGITLPVGSYRQIRLFLAASEDAYVGSISGLTYNNEVLLPGDATQYELRVPSPDDGIKIVPESPVTVSAGGSVRLALDFNLNNDVVEVAPNGVREFILKPRLGYFDMNSVAAVTGTVSFGNLSSSRFVIKAEQVQSGSDYRVVRRLTGVDKTTGRFNLYPLPVFGNATTASYDILLRGLKVQTAIIKGVKVHKGTNPAGGAVDLGAIAMQPGSDFTSQVGSAVHPSGAGVHFYQTITGDPVSYEVRFRHLNPYTGIFSKGIELSDSPIQVAAYDASSGAVGPFAADAASQGSYSAIADAVLYSPGAAVSVVSGASPVLFTPAAPSALPYANSIVTTVAVSPLLPGLSKGQLFVTHGGLVVDSYQINSLMPGGGSFAVANLPGGTSANPLAGANYAVSVLGWGGGKAGWGIERRIDLSSGSAAATVTVR